MRKYLLFTLLTACFFTMAEEDYANVVGKVENWIERNYSEKQLRRDMNLRKKHCRGWNRQDNNTVERIYKFCS